MEDNSMANTTVSKVTITKDNANVLVSNIREGLRTINKGYLGIAPDVQKLYDTKAFEVLGYKNFDEMCTPDRRRAADSERGAN